MTLDTNEWQHIQVPSWWDDSYWHQWANTNSRSCGGCILHVHSTIVPIVWTWWESGVNNNRIMHHFLVPPAFWLTKQKLPSVYPLDINIVSTSDHGQLLIPKARNAWCPLMLRDHELFNFLSALVSNLVVWEWIGGSYSKCHLDSYPYPFDESWTWNVENLPPSACDSFVPHVSVENVEW